MKLGNPVGATRTSREVADSFPWQQKDFCHAHFLRPCHRSGFDFAGICRLPELRGFIDQQCSGYQRSLVEVRLRLF
jgi:hypothetical protein